ncbi:mediator complex subunit [Pseudocyphellaria aurata]|nr:mediator complex subunit [Pseudocyphellaria aurata]
MKLCSVADVLASLLPPTSEDSISDQTLPEMEGILRPSIEASILQMMTLEIGEGLLNSNQAIQVILKPLIAWMTRYPSSRALGFLIYAILSSPLAHTAIGHSSMKAIKVSFGRCLSILIAQLSQTDMQLATGLDFLQKQYDIRDDVPGQTLELLDGVNLGALSFRENVMDNTPVNTRAGLYVYLNALLYGRPLFEDLLVIDYLNAKYKGDCATLMTDLTLAAFDILANAMYRTESTESITLLRSFLVNKLPVFLNNYAAMIFEPGTVECCIGLALVRVDPAAFPSFSQMFDPLGTSSMLSDARQEFLFACALHQLIPEASIENLLGDIPMQSLPASGRYVKNDLVAQCSANPTKIEEFIGELENMEGNAGEIAAALLEVSSNISTITRYRDRGALSWKLILFLEALCICAHVLR